MEIAKFVVMSEKLFDYCNVTNSTQLEGIEEFDLYRIEVQFPCWF